MSLTGSSGNCSFFPHLPKEGQSAGKSPLPVSLPGLVSQTAVAGTGPGRRILHFSPSFHYLLLEPPHPQAHILSLIHIKLGS